MSQWVNDYKSIVVSSQRDMEDECGIVTGIRDRKRKGDYIIKTVDVSKAKETSGIVAISNPKISPQPESSPTSELCTEHSGTFTYLFLSFPFISNTTPHLFPHFRARPPHPQHFAILNSPLQMVLQNFPLPSLPPPPTFCCVVTSGQKMAAPMGQIICDMIPHISPDSVPSSS